MKVKGSSAQDFWVSQKLKLNSKLPSTANRTKPPTKFSPPQRSNLYQAPQLCSAPYKEISLCSILVELSLFVTCGMLQQIRFIGKQQLLWECGRRLFHIALLIFGT
ncbi:hypothetical protein KIL84_021534 [Mauremys mutica]|uniref:Uncharacterized protein n=1 Tax=Mauremys mutica TaxID=74926 RepID=A0A9D3X9E4_9SAUR|nr:hypothetical protein KIL84_021534 [Mauremys mutica]